MCVGRGGIELTLRRATIPGRVEVCGKIEDYLADILSRDGGILEIVALDRNWYKALKPSTCTSG